VCVCVLTLVVSQSAIGSAGLHSSHSVGSTGSHSFLTTRPSHGSGGLGGPRVSERPPHAYVEYEEEEEAIMAVAALHDTEGW
jgi:hypothetical protein